MWVQSICCLNAIWEQQRRDMVLDAALFLPHGENLRGHPTSQLSFQLQVRGCILLGELL